MTEYRKGQRVKVEFEGVVVDSEDSSLVLDRGMAGVRHHLSLKAGVKVTLLDPPDWPPQVGDIWEAERETLGRKAQGPFFCPDRASLSPCPDGVLRPAAACGSLKLPNGGLNYRHRVIPQLEPFPVTPEPGQLRMDLPFQPERIAGLDDVEDFQPERRGHLEIPQPLSHVVGLADLHPVRLNRLCRPDHVHESGEAIQPYSHGSAPPSSSWRRWSALWTLTRRAPAVSPMELASPSRSQRPCSVSSWLTP
jgi:hypothetical protein